MREHKRIVVDVHDPALGRYALRDLVCVVNRGKPGADVEELAYAPLLSEVPHGAGQEVPVRTRRPHQLRNIS
jgi:hypothetical protein